MRKLLLSATAFAMTVFSANAGTLVEPVVEEVTEPDVVATGSSSRGVLLPLLLLVAVVAIVARNDDDAMTMNYQNGSG